MTSPLAYTLLPNRLSRLVVSRTILSELAPDSRSVAELQRAFLHLVRGFGLHRPDRTPCDQPVAMSEAHALLELEDGHELTQIKLARRLGLQKSTVSRLIAQMDEKGWVRRARDDHDRRAQRLTADGARVSQTIAAARRDKFERLLAAIPHDQHDAIIESVRVLAHVSRQEADRWERAL